MMLTTLVLGAALAAAARWLVPWVHKEVLVVAQRLWATRNMPGPPAHFWLGHIPQLLRVRFTSFACFYAWAQQWPIYRIRFFHRPVRRAGCIAMLPPPLRLSGRCQDAHTLTPCRCRVCRW
jgi:hypothetical protein